MRQRPPSGARRPVPSRRRPSSAGGGGAFRGRAAGRSGDRRPRAPGAGDAERGGTGYLVGRSAGSLVEEVRGTARPGQGDRAVGAFTEAVDLLERGRAAAALAAAKEAKDLAPRSGTVREVLGIALYQGDRFRDALRELQAYRRITGRADQNHLIADSHRALGAPEKAVQEARSALASRVSEEVRAEAAIVGAAALADLDRYDEAIGMIRSVHAKPGVARPFDLRVWYAAGDILQRAGRPKEAAAEFRRVVRHDMSAFDAAERLAKLE